ncbi:MAG: hypothetical protein B7Y15_07065 [Bacteroidetes bacterium 24-39-8]|jgi:hypothetical protein|nr:MAG: hypothetical protein B7Y76_11050 [Sphingobacteriia bacterium 35-40-5]OYZ51105.1 MAG: hypothetical protein B7Y15_07065 [Bacteroidetes bacterium 24-39-8]HQR93676.1 hypothetical protein [Sediminibacterium sp.]HQS54124.1 hypothetical protein [Sediminibacterium sp.]
MKWIALMLLVFSLHSSLLGQPPSPESVQFYYNPRGVSYIPALTKPGLIYNGQLYNGKRRLDYLMAQLNNPQYTIYYDQYRSNRTWAGIITVLGTATSIVGLIGTNDNRSINWYLLGGGLILNGTAAVLNSIAAQQLRSIAVLMDQEQKSKGMQKSPNNVGISIPFK